MPVMKVNAHEISEKAGLAGRFVGLKSKTDNEIVDEAMRLNYVSGSKHTILANFAGVFKSMMDGVKREASIRKIDEYLSLTPWSKLRIDDPCLNPKPGDIKVVMRARPLKEMRLRTKGWTIIIEGSDGAITIDSISSGETLGEIIEGESIVFTGANFTQPTALTWEIPETGDKGEIDVSSLVFDATTLTAPALSIEGAENKIVKFTLRMNGKKAMKTALYKKGMN